MFYELSHLSDLYLGKKQTFTNTPLPSSNPREEKMLNNFIK